MSFVAENTKKCSHSLTLPDLSDSTVHLVFFSESSDQNMMTKNQVLLSFKKFIYKHPAASPSENFENFWRYKCSFKIEKTILYSL